MKKLMMKKFKAVMMFFCSTLFVFSGHNIACAKGFISASESALAASITEGNIIKVLHNGDKETLNKLNNELSQVSDSDFDALDAIARKYFQNDNIKLVRNAKLAKSWIRNWLKVVTVFPDLIGVVKLTADSKEHPAGAPNTSSEASLNEITHYNCLTSPDVSAQTKQVKNYNRNYTIVHELGHVIDALLFGSTNEQMLKDACKKISVPDEDTLKEIEKMSQYASEQSSDEIKYSEAFAEALTDVVINGEDASELAKATVKLLVTQNANKEWLNNVREWGMI